MNKEQDEYIKVNDEKIETSIVTLENEKGNTVNLVGAIHIASPKYYDEIFSNLNKNNDKILYEKVKKEEKESTKDKLIFLNNMIGGNLYQNLAKEINVSKDKELSKVFDRLIKKTPEKKEVYEKAKQVLGDQMKVISQEEGIDYTNLPKSWEHADITTKDISKRTSIFSRQNLKYLGMKILAKIAKSKFVMKHIAKEFISGINSTKLQGKGAMDHLNGIREEKVLEKIAEHENTKSKIGVFYGTSHLENLEKKLQEKGYKRTNIQRVEAIRKTNLAA